MTWHRLLLLARRAGGPSSGAPTSSRSAPYLRRYFTTRIAAAPADTVITAHGRGTPILLARPLIPAASASPLRRSAWHSPSASAHSASASASSPCSPPTPLSAFSRALHSDSSASAKLSAAPPSEPFGSSAPSAASAAGAAGSAAAAPASGSSVSPQLTSPPPPKAVPLSNLMDNFLDGTSSVYLEELQRAWEQDPTSVDKSWDTFFRNFTGKQSSEPVLRTEAGISGQTIQESMRLLLLVRAYQVNGHMKANLDPLGLDNRKPPIELDPALYGFSEADLDREFFLGIWRMSGFLSENRPVQTLREILARLEQTYCGTVGYEYMHIADREQCNWLRDKIETPAKRKYGKQRRQVVLDRRTWGSEFESFIANKWGAGAAKRFG